MRLLLLSLLLAAGCTATAQRRPTARELGELQDSVWRRLDILRTTDRGFAACTPERETFDGSANAARASATKRNRKRRRRRPVVRDRRNRGDRPCPSAPGRLDDESPLPPLRTRQPPDPAPKGSIPTRRPIRPPRRHAAARRTEHGRRIRLLPCGDRLRTAYDPLPRRFDRLFRTDYTVCRFQNGRWETLPSADAWNSLLIGIGRPQFPAPGDARQTKEYAYGFTARSRRASIRPYTPVTASAKTFTWKTRATTCSPPILR